MKKSRGRPKKIRLNFTGRVRQDDLLIGSHGHTEIKIRDDFQLSGIIYCPKYSVTLDINGEGKLALRGKCGTIIIKKMQGNCTLDLSEVTYKELNCHSVAGKAIVIAGNTRVITPAILSDEAELHVQERQLIFNPITGGNSRILRMTPAGFADEDE